VHAWLGVAACVAVAGWLGMVGLGSLLHARSLSSTIAVERGRLIGPVLVVLVVTLLLAERIWPAVPRPLFARAHLVDAGYLALYAVVVVPFLAVVETGFAIEVRKHASFLVLGRLHFAPQVLVVVAILVATDGLNWLAHVANHNSAALWRLHAVHHSQEDMSILTTFRTHPLVHVSYQPVALPALVLGAGGPISLAALVVYGCLLAIPHTNVAWSFGPLGRVIVSPAYHRLHHASVPVNGHRAVNFGFVLVCWDMLAGRAVFPTADRTVATGLAGRPVPVEQSARAAAVPGVVLAQLAQPFHVQTTTDGRP
jgi:sterol desaturase/sphingolipid hydroxylase (fatty acid hydroxylase superfamily)